VLGEAGIPAEHLDRDRIGFDPVVRIEAGRLRRSLERYYLVAGQQDPVRIDIPKGGYVPTFTWSCQALVDIGGEDAGETSASEVRPGRWWRAR
ncbi:hypothetical protein ACC702_38380, partial [Rhizobium ruizarguesonis]